MKTRLLCCICLALLCAASIVSCKKTTLSPPAWFGSHSRFYYDYTTDTSYTPDYRLLTVGKEPSAGELFFYETPVDTGTTSWAEIFQIFGNGVLKTMADGLYSHAATDCSMGLLNSSFDFLSIPANPKTGNALPQYGCGHSDAGYNTVSVADTVITVPAGTYHTFCLLHDNGDRSYWNRNIGIIMYDLWQHDHAYPIRLLGTLKLRSMQ